MKTCQIENLVAKDKSLNASAPTDKVEILVHFTFLIPTKRILFHVNKTYSVKYVDKNDYII